MHFSFDFFLFFPILIVIKIRCSGETDEFEWFQRPAGPQCCKNFNDCGCAKAMFWCHPCGLAFCLECSVNGQACDHNIINYSSELTSDFKPDSILVPEIHLSISEFSLMPFWQNHPILVQQDTSMPRTDKKVTKNLFSI